MTIPSLNQVFFLEYRLYSCWELCNYETVRIYSVQSFLKSHPLWVNLYILQILLILDPDEDPLAAILMVDFYALRAREYKWLVELHKVWDRTRQVCSTFDRFAIRQVGLEYVTQRKFAVSQVDLQFGRYVCSTLGMFALCLVSLQYVRQIYSTVDRFTVRQIDLQQVRQIYSTLGRFTIRQVDLHYFRQIYSALDRFTVGQIDLQQVRQIYSTLGRFIVRQEVDLKNVRQIYSALGRFTLRQVDLQCVWYIYRMLDRFAVPQVICCTSLCLFFTFKCCSFKLFFLEGCQNNLFELEDFL